MAEKECLIICLDIREGAREDFKQKSAKCVAEILKDKICRAKKDYISFVLVGTENTDNAVNSDVDLEGYLNIVEYPHIQIPNWNLLINFYKLINEPAGKSGDWLDALVVAMGMFKKSNELFRTNRMRMVLFYDFSLSSVNTFDMFDEITKSLLTSEVDLIVVSSDIAYVDNAEDKSQVQAIFQHEYKNSQEQMDNEKYALRLVSHCNAKLCNFTEALNTIAKTYNKRPWLWNCLLTIGTQIEIAISGIISVKNESHINLKKCWGEIDEEVTREKKFFLRGEEIHPLPEELIEGYMLGGTPVPYTKDLNVTENQEKAGLKFLAFTDADSVPMEYFCGDSLYWIIHRRDMEGSAKKLEALVKAMHNQKTIMLCWKIFSVKFNNPKLVVLLPNKLIEGEPATLSMVELAYHAQHHFWDFPKLCTQKTECTDEQMDAINNLIDSMDLTISDKMCQDGRSTKQKELLPYDAFPHIYEQNVMDVLERKIIHNLGENDEQFQKMLLDKNFVEVYWKLPEQIEENAKRAAKKVKELFPLLKLEPVSKPKMGGRKFSQKTQSESYSQKIKENFSISDNSLDFEGVRKTSPGNDFQLLLDKHVVPLRNTTQRDVEFNFYAQQLREVLWQLIFSDKPPLNTDEISNALHIYRMNCFVYDAFEDYNTWIRDVKTSICKKKSKHLIDFFQSIIVKNDFGICHVDDLVLDEKIACEEFYTLKV